MQNHNDDNFAFNIRYKTAGYDKDAALQKVYFAKVFAVEMQKACFLQ